MGRKFTEGEKKMFLEVLSDTRKDSRFDEMCNYIQHGNTTVWEHCLHVAQTAYCIARRFHFDVDEKALIRGALLHDYFLYDWHEKTLPNKIHGFTHPTKALKEASADFKLKQVERDMIRHHMFPLTITPPKTTEGKILCVADKICATGETVGTRMDRLKRRFL